MVDDYVSCNLFFIVDDYVSSNLFFIVDDYVLEVVVS
jgi:hypothetical protein